ncbi:MAG: alpha/beta hydrolase [Acidimicrobiales bacterium]
MTVDYPVLAGAEPFSAPGARLDDEAPGVANGGVGVLVLHGFTGNPQSMRGLAEALAAAGYAVELPLLPGHGTSVEDMLPTRWAHWTAAAEAAYFELSSRCERVAVAGLSMGGSLACHLASRHPEIAGLVLINPLVKSPDDSFRQAIKDVLDGGSEVFAGIGSDIALPGVSELAYPETPLAAVLSLFEGVDDLGPALGRITCPTILFSSRDDHVVPPESGDLLMASVSGPIERVWLERSYHVATLDFDRSEIESSAVAFVNKIGRS